ncbi:ATP-binding cassette domain-containing protein [Mycobacterium antarcticum]|uniref:ATP-binding cassette domain-containing protein n=1 Tax=Mycolicibacterium sp. TUM20984 TaxID=3023368 RepID=UPI00239F97F0|nr:ATP-binding cassette domain-containing protein [Mycolicibacterium sp. TUM20984]GLP80000.1 sugar ABC transporter ATP-binding protein [Mycolicibacterium sp. TUM20984]
MIESHTDAVLSARDVRKTFGRVEALRGADFDVRRGEVVALMGDNGAGKSTLVKVLSGVVRPDSGEVFVDGTRVDIGSPQDARDAGIETVYQDLALADTLDPAANLFLGREIRRGGLLGTLGFLDNRAMRERAGEVFRSLEVTLRSERDPVGNMSGGQRQGIAVSRAATWAQHVLFLDEPTAALGVRQTRTVLDLVRRVRDRGIAVVLISHSLPEVMAVADRIEVMRLGRRVDTFLVPETTAEQVVAAMTGANEASLRDGTEGDHA